MVAKMTAKKENRAKMRMITTLSWNRTQCHYFAPATKLNELNSASWKSKTYCSPRYKRVYSFFSISLVIAITVVYDSFKSFLCASMVDAINIFVISYAVSCKKGLRSIWKRCSICSTVMFTASSTRHRDAITISVVSMCAKSKITHKSSKIILAILLDGHWTLFCNNSHFVLVCV